MLPGAPPRRRLTWSLQVEDGPGAGVWILSGRLGTTTTASLRRALDEVLAAGQVRVVLDCSGVDYISSAGIAELERAAERVHRAGSTLVLSGLHDAVRASLEVSGAASRLPWTVP